MGSKKEEDKEVIRFTKAELLKSTAFVDRKDVLNVVVGENEKLTVAEAKEKISGFMKGKVN